MGNDFTSSIFLRYFGFYLFFFLGSTQALAGIQDYAHAIIAISTEKKIYVEVADTIEKRSLGLGKRSGLKNGWGMLFVFEKRKHHRFWMKDMKFPLDIVWLDNHKIVHILRDVQPVKSGDSPPIMRPPVVCNFVLEINAGHASELKLHVGQRLNYQF